MDLHDSFEELRRSAPEAFRGGEAMDGILGIIRQHLRLGGSAADQHLQIAQLIEHYTKTIERRVQLKRPHSKAGALKSIESFVTKDVRTLVTEFAAFEAIAEKTLTANPAMHLTAQGVAQHRTRAAGIVDRFMVTMEAQWERLGAFKARLRTLETTFYDRDGWALHLHDRINRLANLFTSIDTAVTSLKRALLCGTPCNNSLEALRALHDHSLDPLAFIAKVFSGHDHPYRIECVTPSPAIRYPNRFLVREILLELVHNAVASNARMIVLTAAVGDRGAATLTVTDDCPGGIPAEVLARLGQGCARAHEARALASYAPPSTARGWGLTTVMHTLIPKLGDRAHIEFISPLTSQGGTRAELTVPIIAAPLETSLTTMTRPRLAVGIVPALNPWMIGITAFHTHRVYAHIPLPLQR